MKTWNNLPSSVKMASTVNELKNSLDNPREGQRRQGGQLKLLSEGCQGDVDSKKVETSLLMKERDLVIIFTFKYI